MAATVSAWQAPAASECRPPASVGGMKFGALLEEKRLEGPEEFCAYYLR